MAAAPRRCWRRCGNSWDKGRAAPPRGTEIAELAARSAADKRLVADPMRLVRVGGQASASIRFVIGGIAFEPHHLALALEGEDLGGDGGEKPAVMGGGQRAAREFSIPFPDA